MQTIQTIICPNCGSPSAERHLLADRLSRTQCRDCDYLLITCQHTNQVVEAYAPGIDAGKSQAMQVRNLAAVRG